jgi:hypothetical protein
MEPWLPNALKCRSPTKTSCGDILGWGHWQKYAWLTVRLGVAGVDGGGAIALVLETFAAASERADIMAFGDVMQYQAAVWWRALSVIAAHALGLSHHWTGGLHALATATLNSAALR